MSGVRIAFCQTRRSLWITERVWIGLSVVVFCIHLHRLWTQGRTRHSLWMVESVWILHVEYVEWGNTYGILFRFSLFCEYTNLECVRMRVICRVNQEYAIRISMAAPPEYVNTYWTRRVWIGTSLVVFCIHPHRLLTHGQTRRSLWMVERVWIGLSLAFTWYCHHQYCMVYRIQTRGRRGGSYIAH